MIALPLKGNPAYSQMKSTTTTQLFAEKLSRQFSWYWWGGAHRVHWPAVCPSLSAVWCVGDELEMSDGLPV